MMKTCKKCRLEKDKTDYYNQKNYRDGLDPMCKQCRDAHSKEYFENNREKIKRKRREWYLRNRLKISEIKREEYKRKKNYEA